MSRKKIKNIKNKINDELPIIIINNDSDSDSDNDDIMTSDNDNDTSDDESQNDEDDVNESDNNMFKIKKLEFFSSCSGNVDKWKALKMIISTKNNDEQVINNKQIYDFLNNLTEEEWPLFNKRLDFITKKVKEKATNEELKEAVTNLYNESNTNNDTSQATASINSINAIANELAPLNTKDTNYNHM